MPYIAQYLLKLSICLAVVYLFYALVLRRLTFHTWNRWYLLGYSLLAFFIPFINISPMLERGAWNENTMVQLIPVMGNYEAVAKPANAIEGWRVCLLMLIVGVAFMLVRLLLQYLSFRYIRKSSKLISDGNVKIYQVDKQIIPFSFGRSIFINQDQHSEHELKEIIRHEFIHVKQRHTADILWSEVVCMLNWYNPFAWLIRQAIRQNLEFIADHQVLKAGLDRRQYQYLLLKVVGVPAFAIANQFNFSSLKKRIAMMNRMRSAKVHLIKFLFVLPLVTILLLAFRSVAIDRAVAQETEKITAIEQIISDITNEPVPVTDTVPVTNSVKGKIIGIRTDSSRTITIRGRTDSSRFFMDASLNGPGNPNRARAQYPDVLYVIDGVVQVKGDEALNNINPDNISSVNVLKGASAEALYGEKGKDGVIVITSKSKTPVSIKAATVPTVQDTVPGRLRGVRITINNEPVRIGGGNFKGVLIIDGEVQDPTTGLNELNPEDIEKIEVFKGAEAVTEYGEKAKEGVIKVTTKKKKDDKITIAPAPEPGRRTSYTEDELQAIRNDALTNNILYIGLENQVPATFKDVPAEERVVSTNQGHIQLKGNFVLVKPIHPGKIELTFGRQKGFSAPLQVLEKRTFTAKFLPAPSLARRSNMITGTVNYTDKNLLKIDARVDSDKLEPR
ncbi:MAG: TonB-dependent receptor plug domain-containing protein [Niastella sp.]|nr:TonB-dependent receptor plug domain-containing protein [Niastella sp.]